MHLMILQSLTFVKKINPSNHIVSSDSLLSLCVHMLILISGTHRIRNHYTLRSHYKSVAPKSVQVSTSPRKKHFKFECLLALVPYKQKSLSNLMRSEEVFQISSSWHWCHINRNLFDFLFDASFKKIFSQFSFICELWLCDNYMTIHVIPQRVLYLRECVAYIDSNTDCWFNKIVCHRIRHLEGAGHC